LAQENAQLRAQNNQLTQQLVDSINTISKQQELLAKYLRGGGKQKLSKQARIHGC
jgi:hypothetical protein